MCTGGRGTEHREEEILYFMDGLLHPRGFPCGSAGKESACNVRGLGSIPGLGRSPREGKGYPLQYCGLETFMDCIGVTKRHKWATFVFTFTFSILDIVREDFKCSEIFCEFLVAPGGHPRALHLGFFRGDTESRYRHKLDSHHGQLDVYSTCCFIK